MNGLSGGFVEGDWAPLYRPCGELGIRHSSISLREWRRLVGARLEKMRAMSLAWTWPAWLLDVILLITLLEGVALMVWLRRKGEARPVRAAWLPLAPGLLLLTAFWLTAPAGLSHVAMGCLALAGLAHLLDLRARLRLSGLLAPAVPALQKEEQVTGRGENGPA
jgi:hypothetical protein